jgi:hypothetical protein
LSGFSFIRRIEREQEGDYWFEEQFWCKAQSVRPLRSVLPYDQRSSGR